MKLNSHALFQQASEVKVAQSCLTLCDPMDYTAHGILQARILEFFSLLQGIFPTQGSNPGLPHCSRFFTSWAIGEAQSKEDFNQATISNYCPTPNKKNPLVYSLQSLPVPWEVLMLQGEEPGSVLIQHGEVGWISHTQHLKSKHNKPHCQQRPDVEHR